MKKIKTILILLVISFAIFSQRSVQATAISIVPSSKTVNNGVTFSLDIGIYDAAPVNSIVLDLSYNPLILDFIGATDQLFLASNVSCGDSCNDYTKTLFEVVPEDGKIFIDSMFWNYDLDMIDLNSYAMGTGTLASLQFKAKELGTSHVLFDVAALFEPGDYDVLLSVDTTPGEVNVVPEPSTLLLLGSGLIASLGVRRFKKKA